MRKDVWPFLSLSFAVIYGRHPAVEGETQRHLRIVSWFKTPTTPRRLQ